MRFLQPLQDLPGDAHGRFLGLDMRRRRSAFRRRSRAYSGRRPQPLCGIVPMPRQLRSTGWNTCWIMACAAWLPSKVTTRGVGVLDLHLALFQHAARSSGCPAPGRAAQSRSPPSARGTVRRWAGIPSSPSPRRRARRPGSPARGCAASPGWRAWRAARTPARPAPSKFFSPSAWACSTLIALAGAVVSKPMAKKTTCLSGFCWAMLHRIQRRIDHVHLPAARADANRSLLRAGHAQHIAKGGEDHVRAGRRSPGPGRSAPAG